MYSLIVGLCHTAFRRGTSPENEKHKLLKHDRSHCVSGPQQLVAAPFVVFRAQGLQPSNWSKMACLVLCYSADGVSEPELYRASWMVIQVKKFRLGV